jgi:hypothetical protein
LGLDVKKSTHARTIAFYIVGQCMKTSKNALFVDLIDSIVEKMVVMMRTTTEIEEKTGLRRCFGTFLSFLVALVSKQEGVRIVAMTQREA